MENKDPERFSEKSLPVKEKDLRVAQDSLIATNKLSNYEKFLNFPLVFHPSVVVVDKDTCFPMILIIK